MIMSISDLIMYTWLKLLMTLLSDIMVKNLALLVIIDVSVLENHHVASSFSVMQNHPNSNILGGLPKDQYKRARALMIQAILNTDMSKHFAELGKFKTRLGA